MNEKACMRCAIKLSAACVNCFSGLFAGVKGEFSRRRLKLCEHRNAALIAIYISMKAYTTKRSDRGARGVMTVGTFERRIKFRQD